MSINFQYTSPYYDIPKTPLLTEELLEEVYKLGDKIAEEYKLKNGITVLYYDLLHTVYRNIKE